MTNIPLYAVRWHEKRLILSVTCVFLRCSLTPPSELRANLHWSHLPLRRHLYTTLHNYSHRIAACELHCVHIHETKRPKGTTRSQPEASPWVKKMQYRRPERAKEKNSNAFALSGRKLIRPRPRALPWAIYFWPFRPSIEYRWIILILFVWFRQKNNRKSNCSTVATATVMCLFLILVDSFFS